MPLTGDYAPSAAPGARTQAERYEATNGAEANDLRGRPIIVLTSVGAKTGKLRKTALMRVEHDGVYAVVGSKGGAPKHPVWYHNLKANPKVDVEVGTETFPVEAAEVEGAERDELWAQVVARNPGFGEYQAKTTRTIPVIRLTRA